MFDSKAPATSNGWTPSGGPPGQQTAHGRHRAAWLLGVLLLCGLVALVLRFGEGERLITALGQADPRWIAVGLALQLASVLCAGAVLSVVLSRAGLRRRLALSCKLVVAKQFTDQSVPTMGIGGTLLVIAGLRRDDVPMPIATAAVLVELLTYYGALLSFMAFAIGWLWIEHQFEPVLLAGAALIGTLALGIPLFALWLNARGDGGLPRWLARAPLVGVFLAAIGEAPTGLIRDVRLLAPGIAFNAGVFALDVLTLSAMLHAVGHPLPYVDLVATFMVAWLAASIGMVPAGLGTFEGASVGMLTLLGAPLEEALAATLLLRGFTFWLPMLPGALFARQALRPREA